jgi:hypothetical protein
MEKLTIFFIGIITLFLFSCGAEEEAENQIVQLYKKVSKSDIPLTDELVEKYIVAYKNLKKQGPQILNDVNKSNGDVSAANNEFKSIESTMQDAGFKDYPEFVVVNARIAWAFNIVEGSAAVTDFEGRKDDGLRQIDSVLALPDIPEETKVELRKSREVITKDWDKNKKWADFTLEKINKLTSDADKEVIKRHRKELLEAFSGIDMVQMK